MTLNKSDLNYGPPPPITKLTYEQDLRLRTTEDGIRANYESNKEDIITLLMALQRQNFVLGNSLTNLVEKWPKVPPIINEVPAMFGILLENKN